MSVTRVVKYALKTKRGKKLLSEAQKLIHKKKSKTIQQLSVKGVHKDVPLRVSSDKQVKTFKQKPKTGGGSERNPQISSIHPGASEVSINQKTLGATIRRMPYIGSRESWNAEMTRMFGGIHMSQDPKKIKKSVKMLTKKLKKKKVVKAAEGGYLAGGLLGQGIRLIYKDPASKAALKKLTHWVKSKYKGKIFGTLGKLELKHRKAEGLVKYSKLIQGKIAKDPSRFKSLKNAEKAKNVFKKTQLQAESYKKKINLITKTLMNRKSNVTLHSEGGEVVVHANVDRSLFQVSRF